MSRGLRILAGDTFESDVKTAVNAITFGHLTDLSGDVFVDREVERSEGY